MHQYLKAIGFNNLQTKKELKELLDQVENTFTHQTIVSYQNWADYCEFQKEYGQNVGITLCGELDEFENFDADYYFPYFEGSGVTTYADVIVEKRIEKEEYVGICEDPKVGISLIFHLQNGIEYMRERQLGIATELAVSVTFSGLALSGKILFPVINSCRVSKSVSQLIGHIFIHFIFQKFLHQFCSRILLFSFLVDLFWKKHPALDVQKCRRHNQEFAHNTKVFFFHGVQILHILIGDFYDRDVIYINFVFFDEVKEKVKRSFKYIDFNGNCHFRVPFCFCVDARCASGQEQDQQESVPVGYGCGPESCVLQVRH